MTRDEDNLFDVAPRVERLICRYLDGQISDEDETELLGNLDRDAGARRLLESYRRIDADCASALRADLARAVGTPGPRRRNGLLVGAAGAVLTAAAVVALSFLPSIWTSPSRRAAGTVGGGASSVTNPSWPPVFVDYRDMDYAPRERQRDVVRDLIGVPGKNEKNEDVIYIFERNAQSTRIIPISGDI